MIFNSIEFAIFLPIVFAIYWLLRRRLWWQNLLVLVASYVFYGWWDPRFLMLIAFTSGCAYVSGLAIGRRNAVGGGNSLKRIVLWVCVVVNLGILMVFKYYDFFVQELSQLLSLDGDRLMLHLVLPVGISFYTFQALSYCIDVYHGRIEPTRDAVAFFAYISFFPQLVAGPIERATHLLPQFLRQRQFDYAQAVDGCRQILWGLFKKMVVADNCALLADFVFQRGGTPADHLLGAVMFAFQIYGDFSGYSDIAIGTAKLFGISLMQNFRTPYFSRDIAEFWRRWHISLTSWFRDYIYIPLGGSRCGKWKAVRNTFIIFLLSGLWHGANWTFVAWGMYHACLFIPLLLMGRNRRYTDTVASAHWYPSLREISQMMFTFILVMVGWIIFRSTGLPSCIAFLRAMCSWKVMLFFPQIFAHWQFIPVTAMLLIEWVSQRQEHGLSFIEGQRRAVSIPLYYLILVAILILGVKDSNFIYFQF